MSGPNGMPPRLKTTIQDLRLAEGILADVLRYLQHEPVMGACVADCLFPLEIGMRIPAAAFERFLRGFFGGDLQPNCIVCTG